MDQEYHASSSSHLGEFHNATTTILHLFSNANEHECQIHCMPCDIAHVEDEDCISDDGEPPAYNGNIVETMPDEVWAEDVWTEEREADAMLRVQQQGKFMSSYYRRLYTEKAHRYWHEFYKRNQDHFYKDRHYLHKIFPALAYTHESAMVNLLEIGCGVGNAVVPLMELNPTLNVVAVDFASSAIQLLSKNPIAIENSHRFRCGVCDISRDELPVPDGWADLILCFFVLSAIAPECYSAISTKIQRALKPRGKVLLRDYGRYDEAQLRFKKGRRLEENFYVRQDGTCAYYFGLEDLRKVFSGLKEEKCGFVLRQQANRKLKQARYRVWVEAVFMKE